MITIDTLRELGKSFPEITETTHFEKISFRVKNKIFATYNSDKNQVCLKFSEIDQNVFSSIDKASIFPVPNKWGKQGWTFVNLDSIKKEILLDALATAYCEVAPKKLSELVRPKSNE